MKGFHKDTWHQPVVIEVMLWAIHRTVVDVKWQEPVTPGKTYEKIRVEGGRTVSYRRNVPELV